MTDKKTEALKLALEALECIWDDGLDGYPESMHSKAITDIREALAEKQEPNFWGVLFAVEESIRNGDCPWQIESAFDEYEVERKSANGIKENNNG